MPGSDGGNTGASSQYNQRCHLERLKTKKSINVDSYGNTVKALLAPLTTQASRDERNPLKGPQIERMNGDASNLENRT